MPVAADLVGFMSLRLRCSLARQRRECPQHCVCKMRMASMPAHVCSSSLRLDSPLISPLRQAEVLPHAHRLPEHQTRQQTSTGPLALFVLTAG